MKISAVLLAASAMVSSAALSSSPSLASQSRAQPAQRTAVHYRTAQVDGVKIFYREAGPPDAPVLLLLHGFPASSFMYRGLIERLSVEYRVIAPDYPGFGYSQAPSITEFSYTFDRLAAIVERFTEHLQLARYAIYMQDFGGPVGFRLAVRHPDRITHLIIQNANAYAEGLPDDFWALARTLWQEPSAANFERIRAAAMSDAALVWNYTHGVQDATRINPDSWILQGALLSRPGNKDAMAELLYDYRTNLVQYPKWQDYLRRHRPPALIVWGSNDVIFPSEGARAYLKDLPQAELHLLDTGHFALEDKADEIAALMRDFLARTAPKSP